MTHLVENQTDYKRRGIVDTRLPSSVSIENYSWQRGGFPYCRRQVTRAGKENWPVDSIQEPGLGVLLAQGVGDDRKQCSDPEKVQQTGINLSNIV